MSQLKRIGIIGGDLRQYYMARQIRDAGMDVMLYAVENASELVKQDRDGKTRVLLAQNMQMLMDYAEIVIGPIPFCRDQNCIFSSNGAGDRDTSVCAGDLDTFCRLIQSDHIITGGNIPDQVLQTAYECGAECYDFMKVDRVAIDNAVATAEGTIAEAVCKSDGNLSQSSCVVFGYGRCAKALAERLNGMKAYVMIVARNETQLQDARNRGYETLHLRDAAGNAETGVNSLRAADYIFNTIPAPVLTADILEQLRSETLIIDIASKPGGTDFAACERFGIKAYLSPGIPGRYAPRASAEILLRSMRHIFFPPFE